MTAALEPHDAFGAFVELLSAHLDDHGATSDDLAARLYLSRSHFDRIIGAAAGETPGRFRRRVLLERAAFALLTTDAPVIDVAVAAGYGSHEAFTRAFERAYGLAPTRWRLAPGPLHLPTPNRVHFHPPAGLRLPSRKQVTSMDLVVRMVEHHSWLVGELVDRAARLDDVQLDEPIVAPGTGVDERPTVRRLLSRLIGQMEMWNNAIVQRDYDFAVEEHESIQSMRSRLAVVAPAFLAQVEEVTAEQRLDDTFVHLHCSPPQGYTYGGLIAHVLTFAAYRRTLVVGALEAAGITDLDNGDPRQWVPSP